MELEQLNEKVVLKNQKEVHKETNFEDLLTRVINKN